MMKIFYLPLVLALVCITTPLTAGADSISQQQAVEIAQQQFPGRVLSVKRKGDIIKVKILSADGEVRIIKIDAGSGKTNKP
jgi:uncharacterized membrane protein YkoI